MSVVTVLCCLGSRVSDRPITRSEESYGICVCLIVCDLEIQTGLNPSWAAAPQKNHRSDTTLLKTSHGNYKDHRVGAVHLNNLCIFTSLTSARLFNLTYSSSFTGFYNPLAGFSLLILEVSRSHTRTQHSR